jgi:ketosteroid isomerase-like protein
VSRRLDELMRSADPMNGAHEHPITGDHNDPLYMAILDRREDVETLGPTRPGPSMSASRSRRSVAAFAAGLLGVLALGALFLLTSPDVGEIPAIKNPSVQDAVGPSTTIPETPPTAPRAVIEHLYALLLVDTDAAAALFTDNAVITFQVPPSPGKDTIEGEKAIRAWLAQAKAGMESIELTRVEVDGETVTFDDSAIQTSCFAGPRCVMDTTGHVAVVREGKIVQWDFGSFTTRPVDSES